MSAKALDNNVYICAGTLSYKVVKKEYEKKLRPWRLSKCAVLWLCTGGFAPTATLPLDRLGFP